MKIRIDVDVTPQEAREFFGLPDVQEIQAELIQQLRRQLKAGGFDTAALLKPLLPANLQAFEAMQRAFWSGLGGGAGRDRESEDGAGS